MHNRRLIIAGCVDTAKLCLNTILAVFWHMCFGTAQLCLTQSGCVRHSLSCVSTQLLTQASVADASVSDIGITQALGLCFNTVSLTVSDTASGIAEGYA